LRPLLIHKFRDSCRAEEKAVVAINALNKPSALRTLSDLYISFRCFSTAFFEIAKARAVSDIVKPLQIHLATSISSSGNTTLGIVACTVSATVTPPFAHSSFLPSLKP
jgi:hypothetical protein